MTGIDIWLKQATWHLSKDSAARVRTEIQDHYESGREAAVKRGLTAGEADRVAVMALGDAKAANRQYREVLLTSAEARMLRDGNWEARAVCSRPWLKRLLLVLPVAALAVAIALLLTGATVVARVLLVAAVGMGFMFAAPSLPVYSPSRARVFRCVKWAALTGIFALAFGPDALKWSWLLVPSLWPLVWIEWTRSCIRRKLPVAEWPKQLYL
jgi:hypothetical protein